MSQLSAAVTPSAAAPSGSSRASRVVWWVSWGLAAVLILPGLRVGPVFDDWFHNYDTRAPEGWWQRLFGLYDFFHADQVAQAREYGMLPWWSDERLSVSFFRPLSSLLLGIDHLWLDGGGFWSHLLAALWFVAVVVAAARVTRLLFGASEARWGSVLFALSSVHVLPLAFVASLYAHVTALFALLSFECLIRALAQPGESQPGAGAAASKLRAWSVLWFLVALAGGESAVVILPLVLSYLWAERGLRRALVLLAPHLLATLLFLGVYFSLDMGAHHSGAYLQPGSLEFFRALVPRFLVLSAGLLTGFPPDLWLFGAQPVQVGLGVAGLGLGALALRAVLRSEQPALDSASARRLLALSAGALLALLPLTSGIPGGRLVMLPSVITCALFGMAALRAVRGWRAGHRWRSLWLGAWVALFGIGLHPLFRTLVPVDMARVARELPAQAQAIAQRCKGQAALAVGVPDPNAAYLSALFLALPEPERPLALHLISMAPGRHRLKPLAPERYELQVEGAFLALPWSRIYRDTPLSAPLALELRGVGLELRAASPDDTRLELRVPASAPVCWLTSDQGVLVPLDPSSAREWTPTPRPL